MELYPYQKEGALWLSQRDTALLADEPGLGKTAQAVFGARIFGCKKILVICPSSVKTHWAREFANFYPRATNVIVVKTNAEIRRLDAQSETVAITSYAVATTSAMLLAAQGFELMIIDEAHFLKNIKALRTKRILSSRGLRGSVKKVWLLTGTPMLNCADELYPMFSSLFPQVLLAQAGQRACSYWGFCHTFCHVQNKGFGDTFYGAKNTHILRRILEVVMLRREKSKVLSLPPIRMTSLVLEPSKLLKELRDVEALVDMNEVISVLSSAENKTTFRLDMPIAQLRRITGLAKVAPVIGYVKDALSGGGKMVLMAYHIDVILDIKAGLSEFKPEVVIGATTPQQREAAIEAFQNHDSCRVFIGQITAAGTGVTLTAAHDMLIVEPSWVPAENLQAAMRIHRIGQDEAVLVQFVTLAGGLDERVTKVLLDKSQAVSLVFGENK